jgi:hypothetical protein
MCACARVRACCVCSQFRRSGMDVVKAIEKMGSSSGATRVKILIAECGEVRTKAT